MFTREAAIDFAIDRGLKGVNFVHIWDGKMQVYWRHGWASCLGNGDNPQEKPTKDRLSEVLEGRGEGWFVSAKVNGKWHWYFGQDDGIPHDVPA